jgi:hypothetical protein
MHLGYYWLMSVHGYVVSSVRTDDPLMKKLRTKSYTLRDGQIVTCRSVGSKLGISESAARSRLNRSDDPKKIYAPYNLTTRLPKKDKLPKSAKTEAVEEEARLWRIVMQMGTKKYD